MVTTLAHIRMNAVGTLGLSGGNEIFSMGLKFPVQPAGGGGTITPTEADCLDLATQAGPIWRNFINQGTTFNAPFSEWMNLTEIRCTPVSATGIKVPGLDTQVFTLSPSQRGTAPVGTTGDDPGVGQTPYQVALCVTMTGTVYSSGPASHGRFYLPVPNLGFDSASANYQHMVNGQMTVGATTSFAGICKTLLLNLDNIVLASGNVTDVSNISSSAGLVAARMQRVSTVSVDNRPDTIRRRSNNIAGQGRISINF